MKEVVVNNNRLEQYLKHFKVSSISDSEINFLVDLSIEFNKCVGFKQNMVNGVFKK